VPQIPHGIEFLKIVVKLLFSSARFADGSADRAHEDILLLDEHPAEVGGDPIGTSNEGPQQTAILFVTEAVRIG